MKPSNGTNEGFKQVLLFLCLLHRHILEGLLQQLPEGLDGLDEGTLGGGVGRLHRGTEADDIEPGVLAQDD